MPRKKKNQPQSSPARQKLRDMNDADLMEFFMDGYEGAFDEIYRRYYKLVLWVAQRNLNYVDAEDVLQDVFMNSLLIYGHRFDRKRGNLKAWLTTFTRRRCMDHWKWAEVRSRIHGQALDVMARKGLIERYDVDPTDHGYDQ